VRGAGLVVPVAVGVGGMLGVHRRTPSR
jgi:hypothetical protein